MKLKTQQFKKHIKKHGVTKARISEDYMDYKAGDIFTFGIGITIEGKRYSKTTLIFLRLVKYLNFDMFFRFVKFQVDFENFNIEKSQLNSPVRVTP